MFFFIGNSINLNEIAAINNVDIVAIITEVFSNPSLLISGIAVRIRLILMLNPMIVTSLPSLMMLALPRGIVKSFSSGTNVF